MKKLSHLSTILVILTVVLAGCAASPEEEACKKQGETYFEKEYGDGMFDNREGAGTVTYTSHYHKKSNRCFILLDENGYKRSHDKLYKMKTLLDVSEKKKIGSFYDIIGISTTCGVLGKTCLSEREWDKLVKSYMEE